MAQDGRESTDSYWRNLKGKERPVNYVDHDYTWSVAENETINNFAQVPKHLSLRYNGVHDAR